jgi:hypothetical protein
MLRTSTGYDRSKETTKRCIIRTNSEGGEGEGVIGKKKLKKSRYGKRYIMQDIVWTGRMGKRRYDRNYRRRSNFMVLPHMKSLYYYHLFFKLDWPWCHGAVSRNGL